MSLLFHRGPSCGPRGAQRYTPRGVFASSDITEKSDGLKFGCPHRNRKPLVYTAGLSINCSWLRFFDDRTHPVVPFAVHLDAMNLALETGEALAELLHGEDELDYG